MSRFFNRCGRYRKDLCLLVAGALSEPERVAIKAHLATCANCRDYYAGLSRITTPLANWESGFLHLEPGQATRASWAKDFQAAMDPDVPSRFPPALSFFSYCRDLIWPRRRIWAGFSAVWLALLLVNISSRETTQSLAMGGSQPSLELVKSYLVGGGLPAEFAGPTESRVAEPPKTGTPHPRSDRQAPHFRLSRYNDRTSPHQPRGEAKTDISILAGNLVSGYGVPASAGGAVSLPGRLRFSKSLYLSPPRRLKPGPHSPEAPAVLFAHSANFLVCYM